MLWALPSSKFGTLWDCWLSYHVLFTIPDSLMTSNPSVHENVRPTGNQNSQPRCSQSGANPVQMSGLSPTDTF